jgi:hypothetical protein
MISSRWIRLQRKTERGFLPAILVCAEAARGAVEEDKPLYISDIWRSIMGSEPDTNGNGLL